MGNFDQDLTGSALNRRNFLKYTGILGAAVSISAGLAACGSTGSTNSSGKPLGTAAKPAGTITATAAFLLSSGFDPMNASSAVATAVNQHIFEALIDLDPVSRKPYLALAAAQPQPSKDGLTWTVRLRNDAVFSDGAPVTADDVAWSFTRTLDPKNAALCASFISFIDSVKASGKNQVTFKLKSPFPLFSERISVIKIVPKAKTATPALAKAFDTNPIGSGPFKLDSSSATSGCVMSNNAAYTGPRPALVTKIVLNTSTDNAARLNDLRGGQSQAIEAVPYLDVSGLGDSFQVDDKQAFNCLFLMFNCSAAPFNDKRVRQALFYAIDTQKVIDAALSGYGTPATSYLDEGNANYQKASTVYDYDPDKAKQLLAAAGASNLSFELVTTDTGFVTDCAPIIIDAWKEIGVTARLNTNPSAAVYGNIVPANSFRVLAASGDPSVFGVDADLLLRWYYYGDTWVKDRMRWSGPAQQKATRLLDQAARSSGSAQTTAWKQVFDLVADEAPLYPVLHTKTVTASDPTSLTNFHGAATTGLYFLGVGRQD
ncbi:ABC transporter substrate-binding protein [Nocardioides sp. DS6]|uniref:ABC transporter substrate-binding protein n=1 Tax=Nocardioides eburneus TaxID=3231482 RepID=A0ABV3SWQ7_9ACTN